MGRHLVKAPQQPATSVLFGGRCLPPLSFAILYQRHYLGTVLGSRVYNERHGKQREVNRTKFSLSCGANGARDRVSPRTQSLEITPGISGLAI